jgi:hypothetical protein
LNVRGAFSVSDPAAVAAKHILLIDDIFTTGATARAASQALLNAGAASVWVATLARARRGNSFAQFSRGPDFPFRQGRFRVGSDPPPQPSLQGSYYFIARPTIFLTRG